MPTNKINIETNPEFASEIVLSIPYAYYLKTQDRLGKVTCCKGMEPFYWFADEVDGSIPHRSLDNQSALKDVPNKWLHNDGKGGRAGVINYDEWECPPYKEHYTNTLFEFYEPYVVLNNIYNVESDENGTGPRRFFDIQHIYNIITYLTEMGYNVIYKRPDNTEFVPDQNEVATLNTDYKIQANVEGLGVINDYDLINLMDGCYNLNDIWKQTGFDYSTINLKMFANASGCISVNGGGYQLAACYGMPLVVYVTKGKELRPMYLEYDDSFIKMLKGSQVVPVYDDYYKWEENGGPKYNELMNAVASVWK